MTERHFLVSRGARALPVFAVLILAGLLLGCEEKGGSRPVHFVEVASPADVAARYDKDGELEELLGGLVRPEEVTYVLVANHDDGYVTRLPADMWFWNRWGHLDDLQGQIRKAASMRTTTDNYQRTLHELSKKVYGESEHPVLVRNTVLGGWSSLKKCAGTVGLKSSEDQEVQIQSVDIGTPSSWATILGSWIWVFGLIAGMILTGYGWHRLGEKARSGHAN